MSLSDDDSASMRAEIEGKIRYWDERIETTRGITLETAKQIAAYARAKEALNVLQDGPISGETDPDWQPRMRTEAEARQWAEQVAEILPTENMRLWFETRGSQIEAIAESHLGRVCCGNRITFEKPWCPDCGHTHSAAVLAEHHATLTLTNSDGHAAAHMADPEKFAERARETLTARLAEETTGAAFSAALDLDRLDGALRDDSYDPATFPISVNFGAPEPCDTFEYQLVLSTEPEDEDETAAKDMSYGSPVVLEAHVFTARPDGTPDWITAGRIDAEWSPTLARICA